MNEHAVTNRSIRALAFAFVSLLVSAGCAGQSATDAPPASSAERATQADSVPRAADARIGGFSHPESVTRDPEGGSYYVSNVGDSLKPAAQDGDGFISQVAPTGETQRLRFLPAGGGSKSALDAPKGMAVTGGTLYVADIDRVVGFDLGSRRQVFEQDFSEVGAGFLNDLVVESDTSLLVSATNLGTVFRLSLRSEGGYQEVASDIPGANGLAFDAEQRVLYAVSFGQDGQPNGGIYRVRLPSGSGAAAEAEQLREGVGLLDGIALLPGARLAFSDWVSFEEPGGLRVYDLRCGTLSEASGIASGSIGIGPADFFYDAQEGRFWVPDLTGTEVHRVSALQVR